jgi:hypothetical protein
VAPRSRRLPLTAASGSSQIAYQGRSHAVDSSSASVLHPAARIQSAPRAVRHSAYASTTAKPATNAWRHHPGVPLRPNSRAVSAGTLWVATSCCCSLIAPRKPNVWTPKPTTPTAATAIRLSAALAATRRRSRQRAGASTRNGSASPAVALTPTPTASTAAPLRQRGLAPLASASAPAASNRISVSLCAPPTASTSSTGFKPTNAVAQAAEPPRRRHVRAITATAAKLERSAIALNVHRPPASPRGAVA